MVNVTFTVRANRPYRMFLFPVSDPTAGEFVPLTKTGDAVRDRRQARLELGGRH
jgi:hypothetical protein